MPFFHTHIITGPIHSRRLGVSLGVNLSPITEKICNYNCVYCECGWNPESAPDPRHLPACRQVEEALRSALKDMRQAGTRPDSVTFSGNGEPTLHPEFPEVIEMTLACVREYFPEKTPVVTVISNATRIGCPEIVEALGGCDNVLLKLDAGTAEMYARINRLQQGFRLGALEVDLSAREFFPQLVANLKAYPHPYTLQTLLFRGEYEGEAIDNASGAEWEAYCKRLREIRPPAIMLYGLDRETPAKQLVKLEKEELDARAADLRRDGFENVRAFY